MRLGADSGALLSLATGKTRTPGKTHLEVRHEPCCYCKVEEVKTDLIYVMLKAWTLSKLSLPKCVDDSVSVKTITFKSKDKRVDSVYSLQKQAKSPSAVNLKYSMWLS